MQIKIIKTYAFIFFLATALTGCNGFFEKDNLPPPKPLQQFTPIISPKPLWSTNVGLSSSDGYLKMNPAITEDAIYTVATTGSVTSINKYNSRKNWRVVLDKGLTSGPGVGNGVVVVANQKGDIIALAQTDGHPLWQRNIASEVISNPSIAHDLVIVKSIDGYVRALSTKNGSEVWSYQQPEPTLLLRGASKPIISGTSVISGFANGSLAKLGLKDGNLNWTQSIAVPSGGFAIQRMIDIDADPILYGHQLYAATYQGKIASVDWYTGALKWSHTLSSYTGMATDGQHVYVSDARSLIWSFNAQTGQVNWRMNALTDRWVTAPAIMGDYLVVGDKEGYLHWLTKAEGRLAARVKLGWPIIANPIVDHGVLYVLTKNGKLSAYSLS